MFLSGVPRWLIGLKKGLFRPVHVVLCKVEIVSHLSNPVGHMGNGSNRGATGVGWTKAVDGTW